MNDRCDQIIVLTMEVQRKFELLLQCSTLYNFIFY